MARPRANDQGRMGDAVLARLGALGVPPALKPAVKVFKEAHDALSAASARADAARASRDDALHAVAAADDVLDASVLHLADRIVGAGMGTRARPFAGFTPHAPSALTALAYATEVREVRAMIAKLTKAKPGKDVAAAAAACTKNANAVEAALKKVTAPQAACAKALGARDALLPAWVKAHARLKKHAAAVWFDDDATRRAVFAPPEAVQTPTTKKRAKVAAPSPTNGAQAAV